MPNSSLIEFSNSVLKSADEENKNNTQNLIDENSSLIDKHKKELELQNKDFLSKEMMRLKNEMATTLAKEKALAKKTFLEKRLFLCDEIFNKIEAKLFEYVKTEEYLKKLILDLNTASEYFTGGKTVISLTEQDCMFLKSQNFTENFIFETCSDSIIGGFTAENKEMRLFLDLTLKTKLDKEKKSFSLNSNFTE